MHEIFCKDTGEKVIGYKDYLKTKHWVRLRNKYHKTQLNECVMCGSNKYLAIHHMTYENIGNENFTELVFLCKECHKKLHDTLGHNRSKFLSVLKTAKKVKEKKYSNKIKKDKQLKYNSINNVEKSIRKKRVEYKNGFGDIEVKSIDLSKYKEYR